MYDEVKKKKIDLKQTSCNEAAHRLEQKRARLNAPMGKFRCVLNDEQ